MLTVATDGTGAGSVASDPAGIDCGAVCAAPFPSGAVVTLTATPAASSTFAGWSGGGCSGAGACTVTMSEARSVTATFDGSGPSIAVQPSALYFGGTSGGAVRTSGQQVTVTVTNGAGVAWTASSSNPAFQVSPTGGSGSGVVTVSVAPGTASSASGTITVTAPGALGSPQAVPVHYTVYQAGSPPFGYVDTPADGSLGVIGSLGVTGWALDDIEVTKVDIWRDPMAGEPVDPNGLVYIGVTRCSSRGVRPDVEAAYPGRPFGYRAGWGFMILTNMLPNRGNGTFRITAYAYDLDGHKTLLGRRTITCSECDGDEAVWGD